jgi:bacterioferritin-associated ferredoxin
VDAGLLLHTLPGQVDQAWQEACKRLAAARRGDEQRVAARASQVEELKLVRVRAPHEIAKKIAGIRVQDPAVTQPAAYDAKPIADDEIVCRCERVTAGELRALIRSGIRDMNHLKAATRAGMGACGGKTCPNLVKRLFRDEGVPAAQVTDLTQRPLVMEVPLGAFAGVLDGEEHWLTDPRFSSDGRRAEHGAVISERTARWCAARSTADALRELEEARLPAGPLYTPAQVLEDPHVREQRIFREVDYPGLPRPAPLVDTPVRLSATPGSIRSRPPTLGEHTDRILGELGYSAAEIAELRRKRVV